MSTMIEVIESHYRENYSRLVKKFTRPLGTEWDAEDVVQTAYERALRYYNPETVQNFGGWFTLVLRNAMSDHLNAERGQGHEELDEFEHEAVCYANNRNLRKTVENMIKLENEDHQPILDFHFLKGYSARDIYEHNKLSYPNTRKIIQRFRDKVKKELTSE